MSTKSSEGGATCGASPSRRGELRGCRTGVAAVVRDNLPSVVGVWANVTTLERTS
jgi:hypothetical protein